MRRSTLWAALFVFVLVGASSAWADENPYPQAPTTIGRRALAVNLSDLAAMGARPIACTLDFPTFTPWPRRRPPDSRTTHPSRGQAPSRS